MHTTARKLVINACIILCIIGFFVGVLDDSEVTLLASVSALWLTLMIYNFRRKKIAVLAFYTTFFAFLLGTAIISQFDPEVALRMTAHDSIVHSYKTLFIALLSTHLGSVVSAKFTVGKRSKTKTGLNNAYRVRKASNILYITCAVFGYLLAIEKCLLAIAVGGYTASYAHHSSIFPSVFGKMEDMMPFAFFVYLATMPSPQKARPVLLIEFIYALILLVYGQRTTIVLVTIIICIYIILYEDTNNSPYSIMKKRYYFYGLAVLPFILLLFDFFMAFRDGGTYRYNSLLKSVEHIMSSLGGSLNVIGFGHQYAVDFPSDKFYSLGSTIDFLTKNILVRPILGTETYAGNTVANALYGNSFSNAITYIVKPREYLLGYGMGSSYIAEAYHDFGYLGVAFFSTIYGYILSLTRRLENGAYIKNAIVLICIYNILFSPRGSADAFFAAFFNYSFLMAIGIIYLLSKTISSSIEYRDEERNMK